MLLPKYPTFPLAVLGFTMIIVPVVNSRPIGIDSNFNPLSEPILAGDYCIGSLRAVESTDEGRNLILISPLCFKIFPEQSSAQILLDDRKKKVIVKIGRDHDVFNIRDASDSGAATKDISLYEGEKMVVASGLHFVGATDGSTSVLEAGDRILLTQSKTLSKIGTLGKLFADPRFYWVFQAAISMEHLNQLAQQDESNPVMLEMALVRLVHGIGGLVDILNRALPEASKAAIDQLAADAKDHATLIGRLSGLSFRRKPTLLATPIQSNSVDVTMESVRLPFSDEFIRNRLFATHQSVILCGFVNYKNYGIIDSSQEEPTTCSLAHIVGSRTKDLHNIAQWKKYFEFAIIAKVTAPMNMDHWVKLYEEKFPQIDPNWLDNKTLKQITKKLEKYISSYGARNLLLAAASRKLTDVMRIWATRKARGN